MLCPLCLNSASWLSSIYNLNGWLTVPSLSHSLAGSITNIDDDAQYKCKDGSSPEIRNKVISGVVGAASSVTSIQVANLLRLFKIPQVRCQSSLSLTCMIIDHLQ